MDPTNDLFFESLAFRLDDKPDRVNNEGMLAILENAVKKHPRVTFVACHFANQTYDLERLGKLFDKYPNLYADGSQRESYLAAVPRYAKQFIEKYAEQQLANGRGDAGVIFWLKQFGWSDKQEFDHRSSDSSMSPKEIDTATVQSLIDKLTD